MAKKKKIVKPKKQEFNHDPFSHLKGFTVSGEGQKIEISPAPVPLSRDLFGSFAEEMEMLGVKPLDSETDCDEQLSAALPVIDRFAVEATSQTDEELFFAAVKGFSVRFEDSLPEEGPSGTKAAPRRMKQLKQGDLTPDASLDLHGCLRAEVVDKLRHFLQNAQHQAWQTLLVITGKGLHSAAGAPILRDEVEQFLSGEGKPLVAEWGRAPKQYGGDGALVLFLRKL